MDRKESYRTPCLSQLPFWLHFLQLLKWFSVTCCYLCNFWNHWSSQLEFILGCWLRNHCISSRLRKLQICVRKHRRRQRHWFRGSLFRLLCTQKFCFFASIKYGNSTSVLLSIFTGTTFCLDDQEKHTYCRWLVWLILAWRTKWKTTSWRRCWKICIARKLSSENIFFFDSFILSTQLI